MTAYRTILIASAAALASVGGWGATSLASNGKAPSTPPGQKTSAEHHSSTHGKGKGSSGSHKCKPHRIAFIASGVLASQTLTKNEDGTYSGEVVLKEVTHTNYHARHQPVPTTLTKVHVVFGVTDTNSDGSSGLDDLKEGDRVHLIGKVTSIAKKCDKKGFEANITIRQVVFNDPAS
jgi:hypothetical protein